jgi:hypothetical protein
MGYSGSILFGSDRKSYVERRDLIPYVGLPCAAFGLQFIGGVLFFLGILSGLTLLAIGMLSLLVITIRNSWAFTNGALLILSTKDGHVD